MSFAQRFNLSSSTQPANKGGTGLTSFTTGDLPYASSATTLDKLAAVGSGSVLLSGSTPTYGKVNLDEHISGILPVASGGSGQSTYTNGEILIGNSSNNSLTKSTLTAGPNVTITNTAGAIEISSTASSSSTLTEYFTPGTYTYNIDASAKYLVISMCGAGGSGSKVGATGSSPRFGGGGGAAMTRLLTIPVDGATTCEVLVAAGAAASAHVGNSPGINGTESTITINGKVIYAYGGGGAPAGSGSACLGGASGGSGANASLSTAGASTGTIGRWAGDLAGMAGGNRATAASYGTQNTPNSSTSIHFYFVGGSGGGGSHGSYNGSAGGSSQFLAFPGGLSAGIAGGGGGASWFSAGGDANSDHTIDLLAPGPGAGSAGSVFHAASGTLQITARGGHGYVGISYF